MPPPLAHFRLFSLALLAAAGLAAADAPPDRVVTVSGSGEIQVAPDKALVMVAVEARNPTLQTAQQEVNRTVERFLALCDELHIPRQQVQSSSANVQAEFDWNNETHERRMLGYFVSRQIQVDLRDLDRLGPLMEKAVEIGVNQVSPPQLETTRAEALRREALSKAADDARLSAEALAKTLGARVGKVRRIASSDVGLQPPQPMERGVAMMAKAGGGAETYETGQIRINAEVTAEFDLLVD
jgi:uncharacterized protein YggE